jgi:deoxyribonuclease-4
VRIGFHVPTAGGLRKALDRALERRCETVQIFVGAPVQWKALTPSEADAGGWRQQAAGHDIRPVFVHSCYLINLASTDKTLWRRSIRRLATDMRHAALLGAQAVVTHLGSPRKEIERSRAWTTERVAQGIDAALEGASGSVKLLLENSAGMGHAVGSDYDQIGEIIGRCRYGDHLGVCLDSAHSFAAGYAWHRPEGLDQALAEAGRAFGLEFLELLHINDSRSPFASRVDRHWHIGKGDIGLEGFRVIVNHPLLRDLPMIMETPEASLEADLRNLRALRRCILPEYRARIRPAPKPHRKGRGR